MHQACATVRSESPCERCVNFASRSLARHPPSLRLRFATAQIGGARCAGSREDWRPTKPRKRRKFANLSGERRLAKTDGMDPARYKRPRNGPRMCEQHPKSEEGSEMEVTTIGIDLAKNVFAVCVPIPAGEC